MEVLARYGTQKQKDEWLTPLLAGKTRSSFAMTEKGVASSECVHVSHQGSSAELRAKLRTAPLQRHQHPDIDPHRGQRDCCQRTQVVRCDDFLLPAAQI